MTTSEPVDTGPSTQQPPPPPAAGPRRPLSDRDARMWAMIAHLFAFGGFVVPFGNLIGPLVLWLVMRDDSEFVAIHAKESLNFQISIMIYSFVAAILLVVLIGFVLLPAIVIFELIVVILAAVAANKGEYYQYPLCIRFVT